MAKSRRNLLKRMGLEAGKCLKEYFGSKLEIRKKGHLDLVTKADEAAEAIIVGAVTEHFPEDGILAEESGAHTGSSPYQWIVDPLDGTTNFTHAFPHFSVSIALAQDGRVTDGLVFDPIKEELFEAHLGEGAFLNGHPIQVGERTSLGDALSVTGFSYDRRERMAILLERVRLLLSNCQGLRRLGSAALDLAYIACGRFDIFLEDGLHAWDMAAGQLLVSEARGVVCLLDGSALDLNRGEILATNGALLQPALEKLVRPQGAPMIPPAGDKC